MSVSRGLDVSVSPAAPIQSDALWKTLTSHANDAFYAEKYDFARDIYEAALTEAVRIFERARRGAAPDAVLLGPMLHTISCHNLAELCVRSGDEDGARGFLERAFEALAATVAADESPMGLRKGCIRHLRVATAALAQHMWERGLSHVAEDYVQRANTLALLVLQLGQEPNAV